jgi:hypothetical protein
MTSATTKIVTPKASYYLQMVCKHFSHKLPVDFTSERGWITFPNAICALEASGDGLNATVEAEDAEQLARFEGVVISHLKRFAHKEELGLDTLVWTAAA